MATPLPLQEPVTGEEPQGDLREPLSTLAEFYRALNTRNLALMEQNWDNTDQAAMDNPLGGIKRGWQVFGVDGKYQFEFYDYTLHKFQRYLSCGGPGAGTSGKTGQGTRPEDPNHESLSLRRRTLEAGPSPRFH